MKTAFLSLLIALSASASASASTLYISANGSGNNSGADAADCRSLGWFNTSGNVSAGTTVQVVGLVGGINIQVNDITLLIPGGSGIVTAASLGVYVAGGVSGLTINGAGGGYVACTANGSAFANQNAFSMIDFGGTSGGYVIENLAITNIYVHTLASDSSISADESIGIYGNNNAGYSVISNCVFSDIGSAVLASGTGTTVLTGCSFNRCNHHIVAGGSGPTAVVSITNCIFGACSNWDTTANTFHNDAIIWFNSATIKSFSLYGCTFNGDMGVHNTAYFFNDQATAASAIFANNLFIVSRDNTLNDGTFTGGGLIANNTFINNGPPQMCLNISGGGAYQVNNLFVGYGPFDNIPSAISGQTINNNIYVNPQGGIAWVVNGSAITTASGWTAASGEASSQYFSGINSAVVVNNSTGALAPGSPAIGAGANLYSIFQTDINGVQRPNVGSWSIGAFCVNVTGSLAVQISPPSAVAAGAEWQVDDGTFETNGTIITNLPVGQHVVGFNPLAGWMTPSNQSVSIASNSLATVSATYTNVPGTGGLQVTILPQAAVAMGATWQTGAGPIVPSGTMLTAVPSGSCTVSFSTNVANWTPPPPEMVAITNGQFTLVTNIYTQYNLHVIVPPTNDLNGLVGWWTLDDLSGSDVSGNGNNGTFVSSPTLVTGIIANAVSMNGVNHCFNIPNTASIKPATITFMMWLKLSSLTSSTQRGAASSAEMYFGTLDAGTSGSTPTSYGFYYNGGTVYFLLNNGAADPSGYAFSATNTWHHIAGTYNGSVAALYVDGVLANSQNYSTPIAYNANDNLTVGQRSTGTYVSTYNAFTPGIFDDVRIYNRALSASEIANQYLWPTISRQ